MRVDRATWNVAVISGELPDAMRRVLLHLSPSEDGGVVIDLQDMVSRLGSAEMIAEQIMQAHVRGYIDDMKPEGRVYVSHLTVPH